MQMLMNKSNNYCNDQRFSKDNRITTGKCHSQREMESVRDEAGALKEACGAEMWLCKLGFC